MCYLHAMRYTKFEDKVHERLREARIGAGLGSARKAAARLEIPASTYVSYENGSRSLSLEVARNLAARFGVSVSWLLTGHEVAGGYAPWENDAPFRVVPVDGIIGRAGLLKTQTMPVSPWANAPALLHPELNDFDVRAWELDTDSVDRLITGGQIVYGIRIDQIRREPRHGEIVLLEQTLSDVRREWPVRVCEHSRNGILFVPNSSNPVHSTIRLDEPSEPDLVTKVLAVLVGAYVDLRFYT